MHLNLKNSAGFLFFLTPPVCFNLPEELRSSNKGDVNYGRCHLLGSYGQISSSSHLCIRPLPTKQEKYDALTLTRNVSTKEELESIYNFDTSTLVPVIWRSNICHNLFLTTPKNLGTVPALVWSAMHVEEHTLRKRTH